MARFAAWPTTFVRRFRTFSLIKYGIPLTALVFLLFLFVLLQNLILYLDSERVNVERLVRTAEKIRHARQAFIAETTRSHHPVSDPQDGPGEMGEPVKITKEGLSPEQGKIFQEMYDRHFFNEYVSTRISVNRKLEDMRSQECKNDVASYRKDLPDTSVIMCFYNEAWSTLLRSMHSVLNRTPSHLLKELLLVDDGSTFDHLKSQLDEYVAGYPKVRIVRANARLGLIKCRILGYREAIGTVLTFLDAHIECTTGWLEPLLDRIASNSTTVVWPAIDGISHTTFEYKYNGFGTAGSLVGGFDWGMQFNWHAIPDRDNKTRAHVNSPIRSPTMCGGLFSIDRKYFEYLGTYDSAMDIWGGENLELSFKIWMCGGTIEMVPCSHVGHVFRPHTPYILEIPHAVWRKNFIRVAEVWLDDYKRYYYERINFDLGEFGDISERAALRKRLNCKSFQWYVDNVYPEIHIPDKGKAWGEIRNEAYDEQYCMDANYEKNPLKTVHVSPCHGLGYSQFFSYSNESEIRRDMDCLDYATNSVVMYPCHGQGGNQLWIHDEDTGAIRNPLSNTCLEMNFEQMTIVPAPCNASLPQQSWTFSNYNGVLANESSG